MAKYALITGAARGIGKSIALTLAKKQINIIINDIEPMKEEAQKTVEEIKQAGEDAFFVAADVSDFDSCTKMIEEIKSKTEKKS